eukprot:g889.t1
MTTVRRRSGNTSERGRRCSRKIVLVLLVAFGLLVFWRTLFPSTKPTQIISPTLTSPTEDIILQEEAPRVNFSNPKCRKFRSQHGEDAELFVQFWAFPEVKTDGIFLEIGAFDGLDMSNSYWYEMCLGWTGVLIEGHPSAAQKLRDNRPNATNFEAAACETDNGTVNFVGVANGVSGDITKMPADFARAHHMRYYGGHEETHEVKCRLISSMLREAGVDHVDFWTLDVEGAEFTVLDTYDWEKVPVHVIIIENDKDQQSEHDRRHKLLTSKGMEYGGTIYNNELWVNPKYPNVSLSPSSMT